MDKEKPINLRRPPLLSECSLLHLGLRSQEIRLEERTNPRFNHALHHMDWTNHQRINLVILGSGPSEPIILRLLKPRKGSLGATRFGFALGVAKKSRFDPKSVDIWEVLI